MRSGERLFYQQRGAGVILEFAIASAAREDTSMTEPMAPTKSQILAAKRWMDDEAGMERASLSPAEYVAYRMKISAAEAEALVAAVYALDEESE